jgi:4-diphosphocytidyl-2-C-methyl-D-erythritol kinase
VTPVTAVTARAPAKVNLQLAVGPPRAHGYHDLVTVFHAVSLFDEVTIAPAQADSVVVTGEGAGSVPADGTNLAVRAADELAKAVGPGCKDSPGLAIRISKRIPVAAGLAGGSADAAAALVACNELWGAGLTQPELSEVAAGLGSDVPFALAGGTAIGQGRGELLTAALVTGTYHWVLAFSSGGLATPEVYAACDRLRAARAGAVGVTAGAAAGAGQGAGARPGTGTGPAPVTPGPSLSTDLMAALRSGDPAAVGPLLSNDLQSAAVSLRPELRRTLAAGRELGALGAIVSGSGPTCAFLAADADRAKKLALSLTGAGAGRGVVRVRGPVGGAAVMAAEPG